MRNLIKETQHIKCVCAKSWILAGKNCIYSWRSYFWSFLTLETHDDISCYTHVAHGKISLPEIHESAGFLTYSEGHRQSAIFASRV